MNVQRASLRSRHLTVSSRLIPSTSTSLLLLLLLRRLRLRLRRSLGGFGGLSLRLHLFPLGRAVQHVSFVHSLEVKAGL